MSIQFLHGDCLELMKTLPDKSIDCFVCDLPYGCLTGGGGKEKKMRREKGSGDTIAGCDWDVKIDLVKFWEEVERLARNDNTPVIHFCNARFGFELFNSKPDWFRYDLVWEKTIGVGFLSANKQPLRSHENIYVFSKKGAYYKRVDVDDRCVKSVVCIANKKRKGKHPTQKPVELYKWILERYCPAGGPVLDPPAGSFNSCFVGKELGLNCIGIEQNEEFFKKAVDRSSKTPTETDNAQCCKE